MMELYCGFRAFEQVYVAQSVAFLRQVAPLLGMTASGMVPRAEVRRRFTLLRGPHGHKTAREQFESRRHGGGVLLRGTSSLQVASVLALLRDSHLPGVECHLRLRWRDHLPQPWKESTRI